MADPSSPADAERRSPPEHRLMFCLLVGAAFAVFAPAVLLPVLKEHCDLLAEERRIVERITVLDQRWQHFRVMQDAFAHDAEVNERLAKLDLQYHNPDEIVLPVLDDKSRTAPIRAAAPPPDRDLVVPQHWPEWGRRLAAWGNERGLIDLYLNADYRRILLLMAGGLVIAAFVLYAPGRGTVARNAPIAVAAA